MGMECIVQNCTDPIVSLDMCRFHYKRQWKIRHGLSKIRLNDPKKTVHEFCSVTGCKKPHKCKSFCQMHYRRYRKYGNPLAGGVFVKPGGGFCEVPECNKITAFQGLCSGHYDRWQQSRIDPRKSFVCYICGKKWSTWPLDKSIALDHINPKRLGGGEVRPV